MAVLYLSEQGSKLSYHSKRLVITKDNKIISEIPVFQLDRVLIFGNVQVTTQALTFLLKNGVDLIFLTSQGNFKGKVVAKESKNIYLRLAHYDRFKDEEFKLSMAKSIVQAKVHNQKVLLLRYQRNYPSLNISPKVKELEDLIPQVEHKQNISAIMGIEGTASATYFKCLGKMFREGWNFENRTRHPPLDPVNALLSLGYVMITNELSSLIESSGLDPMLAFLHSVDYGRISLAMDIVEEFRQPVIDSFTLKLINNQMITKEDFEERQGGIYLIPKALKKYFAHFDERLTNPIVEIGKDKKLSYRQIFRTQIEKLEHCILEKELYKPFRLSR